MKFRVIIFSMIFAFLFAFIVYSDELKINTGLELIEMSREEKESIKPNLSVYLINTEPKKAAIKCFDVNENNLLAIGTDSGTISIYDLDGNFKYGYKVNTAGSYGFEWDGDNLIIYFIRSSLAVLYDSNCQIKAISFYEDNANNSVYMNKTVFARKKVLNDCQYVMKTDMGILNIFAINYSQIEYTDMYGESKLIYDVNDAVMKATIGLHLFNLLFVLTVIFGIIYHIKKKKKNT